MKFAAFAFAAALGPAVEAPSPSQPPADQIAITVSAEDAAKCAEQGGCALFTRQYIEELVTKAKHDADAACYRSRQEI